MLVCKDHQFIFVRNPKTASRSISEMLKKRFVVEDLEYHDWRITPEYSEFYTFMCVRNPFHRTVSAWNYVRHDRLKRGDPDTSFEDFVRFGELGIRTGPNLNDNFFAQSEFLDKVLSRVKEVHLIKHERLVEDLVSLPFLDGYADLPKIGVGNVDWRCVYDLNTEALVEFALRRDFDRFGYCHSCLTLL